MSASVDLTEFNKIAERFNAAIQKMPEARRKAHEAIAQTLLDDVRSNIGGTGKVAGWQESVVGTRGGYAAVRAKAKTYDRYGYAVGAVTNAIEHGHKVAGYGARRVAGRYFYTAARGRATANALKAAQDFLDVLQKELTP